MNRTVIFIAIITALLFAQDSLQDRASAATDSVVHTAADTSSLFKGEILTMEQAVAEALEKNYDIQIAYKEFEESSNSATAANASLLPTVTGTGGINYVDNSRALVPGGASNTTATSLGLNAKYTLFNGLYNINYFKSLKGQERLSAAQTQAKIEQNIMAVIAAYLGVATAAENQLVISETFEISRTRYEYAKVGQEYASTGKLAVLRAEVDFYSDSTNLIIANHAYDKALNTLNRLLVRELKTPVVVDTALVFNSSFEEEQLLSTTLANSSVLRGVQETQALADLQISMNRSAFIPQVDLLGGIDFIDKEDDFSVKFDDPIRSARVGLQATWYLYDGRAFSRYKNAKIGKEKADLQELREREYLKQEVVDGLNTYTNALEIYKAEQKSVEVAQLTFERTDDLARLGQVTSTEYREVQKNLAVAKGRYVKAKNSAKVAEYQLLRLQGELIAPIEVE